MKTYPSIPKALKNLEQGQMWIFDKPDGSNLRFEWSKGQGWYKFGSRTRLFDETDTILGPAKPLFMETLSEPLTKIATDNKWQNIVVFGEFWGPGSFAGQHVAGDAYTISLFDAAPYKKGILGPEEFLKIFGHLNIATYLGKHVWDAAFVERVRTGDLPDITFEGVIGKRGEGHKLEMVKAKTQVWMDKVRALYAPVDAEKLLAS